MCGIPGVGGGEKKVKGNEKEEDSDSAPHPAVDATCITSSTTSTPKKVPNSHEAGNINEKVKFSYYRSWFCR